MTEPAERGREDLDRRLAAMEPIFMDVMRHVEAYARKTTTRIADPLEITQELAKELWVSWSTNLLTFVPPENNKAYAEQAVRNYRKDELKSLVLRDEVIDADADLDELEVAGVEGPYDDVCNTELQQTVNAETAEMSNKMRVAWEMRTNGHTYEEIAEELGISEGAARKQYARASKRLRESPELQAYMKEDR